MLAYSVTLDYEGIHHRDSRCEEVSERYELYVPAPHASAAFQLAVTYIRKKYGNRPSHLRLTDAHVTELGEAWNGETLDVKRHVRLVN